MDATDARRQLAAINRGEVDLDDAVAMEFVRSMSRWVAARLLRAEIAAATNGAQGTPMNGVEARQIGQLVEQMESVRRVLLGRPPLMEREAWRRLPPSVNVDFRMTTLPATMPPELVPPLVDGLEAQSEPTGPDQDEIDELMRDVLEQYGGDASGGQ